MQLLTDGIHYFVKVVPLSGSIIRAQFPFLQIGVQPEEKGVCLLCQVLSQGKLSCKITNLLISCMSTNLVLKFRRQTLFGLQFTVAFI